MKEFKGNKWDNWLEGVDYDSNLITAGGGNDTLIGGQYADEMYGEAGNDRFIGGGAADWIIGGDGMDEADYAASPSGVSVNLLSGRAYGGTAQGDILREIENLYGSNYADALTGDRNDNILWGNRGNDVLVGEGGNDTLNGGEVSLGFTDNDTLTGGRGADTFQFLAWGTPWGKDVITDFQVGVDRLEFQGNGVVDSLADLEFTQVGNDTVITANDFIQGPITFQGESLGSIVLLNVSVDQLLAHRAHDFLFT